MQATLAPDGTVLVVGAPAPHLAIVPVSALELGADIVPTAGAWHSDTAGARFAFRFRPAAGAVLVVVSRPDPESEWRECARVEVPGDPPVETTEVVMIDPRCSTVPSNLLRVSVTFSTAMEEGSAAGRIALRGADGTELEGTLLDMPPELWDRDRRRLTVLLEPGRIKRGLQPNLVAGPPLREGETVTVVIDPRIRDGDGAGLVAPAQRTYRVGPPLRSRVDPSRWRLDWPEASHGDVVVRFDRPMDRALIARCLRVIDEHGATLPGRAGLDDTGFVWRFTPSPGAAAAHALRVDTRLEDLAGNSLRRVFDRDLDDPTERGEAPGQVVITRNRG